MLGAVFVCRRDILVLPLCGEPGCAHRNRENSEGSIRRPRKSHPAAARCTHQIARSAEVEATELDASFNFDDERARLSFLTPFMADGAAVVFSSPPLEAVVRKLGVRF
jgi:hypothetical protein